MRTHGVTRHFFRLNLLPLLLLTACTSDEHPPLAGRPPDSVGGPSVPRPEEPCETPTEGCACSAVGQTAVCGELRFRSRDYLTCAEGQRVCSAEGVWSACSGEQLSTRHAPLGRTLPQALRAAQACEERNPCDPLCQAFQDSGEGLQGAADNVCVAAGGLAVCPGCGYTGAHAENLLQRLPDAWQRQPATCDRDDDCGFDQRCIDAECQDWTYPCHDTTGEACGEADLVLGPPCLGPSNTYHVQVCNRGSRALSSGTLSIGLYADPAHIGRCSDQNPLAPDSGSISFTLGTDPGQTLEPGRCLELTPANSAATGLRLGAIRAIQVNHDGALGECNFCNNWNVLDPAAECSGCTNLECSQTCAATTLTGVVRDPRGEVPLPGVTVYVPNGELADFPEGVACDTCANLYSGSPIASAVTGHDGSFSLQNAPANTAFPLVIQTGRWRRRVTVAPIERCGTATLEPDLARLPRTQRRCAGATCVGEGDIPQTALILGDADPLQCLFRKVGIAESEFTTSQGNGRIHLFTHNGMRVANARAGFDGNAALLSDAASLDRYSAVFAPCDFRHDSYSAEHRRSGPSYNSHPAPTANAAQRANVKSFLDRGGRLFTTHWLSLDFVHLNYDPPPPTPFVTPLDSPALTALPGWAYADPATFNPNAPVRHQFGENVERGGNTRETADQRAGRPGPPPPSFDYAIDVASPLGQLFSDWASVVNASPAGRGTVTFDSWGQLVESVRAPAIRLAHGDSHLAPPNRPQEACVAPCATPPRSWGGPHAAMFQFDTPWGAPQNEQCGRVVVAQSHVAEHPTCQIVGSDEACQPGLTPPDCACLALPADPPRSGVDDAAARAAAWNAACGAATELTPQEKAFEFLIFSTTQCLGALTPPPPATVLGEATFVREYEAACAPGERVEWQYFSWKSAAGNGTWIDFYGQTAERRAELSAASPVWIGSADSTSNEWLHVPDTVNTLLQNAIPPQASRRFLRVTMLFHPQGNVSPVLNDWQLVFNCRPYE